MNSTFQNNSAEVASLGYHDWLSSVLIEGSFFYNNSALNSGGGFYLDKSASMQLKRSEVRQTMSLRGAGGVFFMGQSSTLKITDSVLKGTKTFSLLSFLFFLLFLLETRLKVPLQKNEFKGTRPKPTEE